MAHEEENNYKELLEKNRVDVVQSLDLDRQFLLSYLRSNLVFDDEDCQLILNSGSSRQQKNAKFLDVLACRGMRAYKTFVDALEFEHSDLYKLFTGKDAAVEKSFSNGNKWADHDREFLAKELSNLSDQYRTLAYMQSKTMKEKQIIEKKLIEATGELSSSKKYIEELNFELAVKRASDEIEESQEHMEMNKLLLHCQALAQDNSEKSNIIIALQARLLTLNEEYEKKTTFQEDMQMKHKNLMQQVKDLTVNYDFQRHESLRLKEKVEQKTDVLEKHVSNQREIHSLKFQLAKVTEERDEALVKLEEFKSVVTALSAKLSLLQEERDNETGKRDELSEEFLKIRHQLKTVELERNQYKNSVDFYKDKSWRYCDDINTHREQVSFLSQQLQNAVDEKNRICREKEVVIKYNKELLISRDEGIRNQLEITEQFEKRYREVSKQLDESKREFRDLMLQYVRSNSSSDNHARACIFEEELASSQKDLAKQQITLTPGDTEQKEILKPMVETEIKLDLSRTETRRLLDSAYESLTVKGRRKSAPADFALSNRHLSLVYESLQGHSLPFNVLLGNSAVFPQFEEEQPEPEQEKGKRRFVSRKSDKKGKNKTRINGALTSICPMLPMPVSYHGKRPKSPSRSQSNVT